MEKLKWRLLEVVEENQLLHAELKQSVVDDIVKTADVPLMSFLAPTAMPTQPPLSQFSCQKWQTELVMHIHFTDIFLS